MVSPNWRSNLTNENAKSQLLNFKLRDLQGKSDTLSNEIESKTELIKQLDKKCTTYNPPKHFEFQSETMQSKIQDLITENENLVRSLAEERRKTKQLEIKQDTSNDTSLIKDADHDVKQNLLQELEDLDYSGKSTPREEETKRIGNKLAIEETKNQNDALEKELEWLRRTLEQEQSKKKKDRSYCGFCA